MANARVSRGRQSQVLLANYLRENGWPDAKAREASLPGTDIYDCWPLSPEVKATGRFDITGALRQARNNAGNGIPFVVYRPSGYGEARIKEWPVIFDLEWAVQLLRELHGQD